MRSSVPAAYSNRMIGGYKKETTNTPKKENVTPKKKSTTKKNKKKDKDD